MNKVERVFAALAGEEFDIFPRGELNISDDLVARTLDVVSGWGYKTTGTDYSKASSLPLTVRNRAELMELLGMDLLSVDPKPVRAQSSRPGTANPPDPHAFDFAEIREWRRCFDFFVFSTVGGGFSDPFYSLDPINFLKLVEDDPVGVKQLIRSYTEANAELAARCVEAGSHAIIVADDIAHAGGLFVKPEYLRELLFESLAVEVEKIKSLGVPVVFHSDGNVYPVIPDLISMGFDGIHSFDPTAGMELLRLKKEFGNKVCLFGNVDMYTLSAQYEAGELSLEDVEMICKETMRIGVEGGRYIFGSSSGHLDRHVSPHVLAKAYLSLQSAYPI